MLKQIVANKALGIIAVLLLVLINVAILTGAELTLNTETAYASSYSFNTASAVNYAEYWWDKRNTDQYHDYGNVDCANFVSQCLIAGGLNLRISPYVDSWGCIPSCDNLHTYLANYLGVRYETQSHSQPVPSWFGPGDVAMFGDSRDPWQHSVFAVATDVAGNALVDAHSNNRNHVTIQFYIDSTPAWSLCSYYNVSEAANLVPTFLDLSDSVAARGKAVVIQASISTGDGILPGVTIKFFTQQSLKNVLNLVSIGSASSDSNGKATVSLPYKSVTMNQQPIKALFVGDDKYAGSVDTAVIRR